MRLCCVTREKMQHVQWGYFILFYLNNNFSTLLGFRRFLILDRISPAFKNTLSHVTDEAGVHKCHSKLVQVQIYLFLSFPILKGVLQSLNVRFT